MIKNFCLFVALTVVSLLATTATAQPAVGQPARPKSTPRPAATPDVTGWNKVTWGMKVAQAKKLFGADVTEPESRSPGGRYPVRFVVNKIDIGGLPCTASIETDRDTDSIAGVAIEPAKEFQELPNLRGSAFNKLKEQLIQKYGKPKSDDQRQESGDQESSSVVFSLDDN